ncbi:MAG TPA: methyltransferase domain-containing protein [Bryobacteraceae bacterium]|jgi:ubiquinone/menaquinone biosynthesis C-methylase UbiE
MKDGDSAILLNTHLEREDHEMPENVDLYDHAYGEYDRDVYQQIRVETYDFDLGQTSWVTTEESNQIPKLLNLGENSQVLEIGFGSGRYALYLAEQIGCRIVGVDINTNGVQSARELARKSNLQSRVKFQQHDASKPLPFKDVRFDAVFSNDVLCHIGGRASLLRDVHRVLKPGGRLLFSDALVIGGLITSEEIATRSSIGFYIFAGPGVNEQLLAASSFRLLQAIDTTQNAAQIAKRWHDARARRSLPLRALEGDHDYEGLQRFLSCVHALTSERRLTRWVYVAAKG